MTIQCPRCPPNEDRRFISPKELVYHMDVEHPLDSLTGEIPGGSADPVDPGNKTVADLVERLEVAEIGIGMTIGEIMDTASITTSRIDVSPEKIRTEMQAQYDHYGELLDQKIAEIATLEVKLALQQETRESLIDARGSMERFLFPDQPQIHNPKEGMDIRR